MNSFRLLAFGLVSAMLLSCSVTDTNGVSNANSSPAQVSTALVATPAVASAAQTSDIQAGKPVAVTFSNSTATLQVQKDSAANPVVTVVADDGVTTYFRKPATAKVSLRKTGALDEFLQGVWVAFAQMKSGVWFELIVDSNNQITMTIAPKDLGIQIDIKVQGTPSNEDVAKVAKQFTAWQQASSSLLGSSTVASSSSIAASSKTNSSSSTVASSSSIKVSSSSSSNIIAVSSSSFIIEYPTSSSSIASSSNSSCLTDTYRQYFLDNQTFGLGMEAVPNATCTQLTIYASGNIKYDLTLTMGDVGTMAKVVKNGTTYPYCMIYPTATQAISSVAAQLVTGVDAVTSKTNLNLCALALQPLN